MRGSRQFQRGGGGGGIASRGRFVPVFLRGNKWQLMIFMGRSGPPAPSVSAHIRVSNSLNSHFIIIFFAGPRGRFSREVRTSFSSRKQMATYDFHGEVRTPAPSVSAHIRVSNSLNSHLIIIFFLLGLVNSQNVC